MRVELGNQKPTNSVDGWAVTYVEIPDGVDEDGIPFYGYTPHESAAELAAKLHREIALSNGITRVGDISDGTGNHEAFLAAHSAWGMAGERLPSFVASDNDDFAKLLAEFYGCPLGRPSNYEGDYWTRHGSIVLPPGVTPASISPVNTKTNAGMVVEWNSAIGLAAGETNTATATSATSLTRTGAGWTTNQFAGMTLVTASAYGLILSNTATVLTIDRWYNPASPGGGAASTPGGTSVYSILPQSPPSPFMGLTANASAVSSSDTTLPSEITTAGGGLIRKIGTLSYTSGNSTGTVTGVFTANGSDSLPVTIAKMGIGPSLLSGANQLFQTLLSATATLSASGDQLTVTDTVTT